MSPTLMPGKIVFATNLGKVKKDMVVIAMLAGREVIKRVHTIDVNGFELRGDNSQASTDSRQRGPIKHSDIIGRVLFMKSTNK